MELRSLSALTQLAERAEQLATEIRELNITADDDVQIPHVTLPLKLESAAEWLKAVDECRRKPRLARSKRLLEAVKIDTASIPADVLTRTESIDAVLEGIKAFPAAIQQSAIAALGRALTKGLDDAASVVEQFSAAADALAALEEETADQGWIYDIAATMIAERPEPEEVSAVADQAQRVLQHCKAATSYGVTVDVFETFDEALRVLSEFSRTIAENSQRLAAEGLPDHRPDIERRDVVSATALLQESRVRLDDEKHRLAQRIQELLSQLRAVGGSYDADPTTLAELRETLPELESALERRRSELRQSLGTDVFKVVELLAKGEMPPGSRVNDAVLGQALRKAVDCGYRVRLEAPHEDQ